MCRMLKKLIAVLLILLLFVSTAFALTVSGGRYTVGEDIPAGYYTFAIEKGLTNLTVFGANYDDYETNGGLLLNILLDANKNPILGKVVLEEGNIVSFDKSLIIEKYVPADYSESEQFTLPGGRYTVGEDIPAGSFSVRIETGLANLTVWGANYNDYETNNGLLVNILLQASDSNNNEIGKLVLEEGNIIDFTAPLVFTKYHGLSFD